ncbi:MAG: hypothetical protein IJU62_04815 [Muribaculaceae bacterium]|nr:hypothetical protein [Muribaculaceae bacterium]
MNAATVSQQEAEQFVFELYGFTDSMSFYSTSVTQIETDSLCCNVPSEVLEQNNWLTDGSSKWLVFVDELPKADWCHPCSYYYISKTTESDTIKYQAFSGQMPPELNMEAFSEVPIQTLMPAIDIEQFEHAPIIINANDAQHIHVVLYNGGYNAANNYIRYWNNLSYIYKTLVNIYGVPKSNITVLSAGGRETAYDTNLSSYNSPSLIKQNLDLDNDSTIDINYDGTRESFTSVMDSLANVLTESEHLFLYVTDHGASYDKVSNSYICAWNRGRITKTDMSSLLDNFTSIGSINIIMGQCYSGGFVDAIASPGRVIMTSCSGNEVSYSTAGPSGRGYFLGYFTDAIAGYFYHNGANLADSDKNGVTSMREAFYIANYYNQLHFNSTNIVQTPLYSSVTAATGDDWAFNSLPKAVSLYVKDNSDDTGKEFNTTTNISASPDIWLKKRGTLTLSSLTDSTHVTLDEFTANSSAYTYVRIRNRGHEDYNGSGKYLHIFWAEKLKAPTSAWEGINNSILGGYAGSVEIQSTIPAGHVGLAKIHWSFPASLYNKFLAGQLQSPKISLLAVINDSASIDLNSISANDSVLVLNHNNAANLTYRFAHYPPLFSSGHNGISSLQNGTNYIAIHFKEQTSNDTQINLTSIINPAIQSTISINGSTESITVDTTQFPSGPISVSLIEQGVLIESKQVMK